MAFLFFVLKGEDMTGYYTSYGYMGLVNSSWMLFATEAEYYEYLEEVA